MMKKYIFVFISCCFLSACSNFLKEEDKDQIIPRAVDHYFAIMQREAVENITQNYLTDFMTDDITENPKAQTARKNTYKNLYTWQGDIEQDANGLISDANKYWKILYRLVLICNYTLENIEKATGAESERAYVRGEAYFTRAKCYFELVNLYARSYDPSTAETELGVPERLGTGIEQAYVRSSVAGIYRLVESDLKQAITQFTNSGLKKSIWHPNISTAELLLSRVYLYKSDWDNCIEYASRVISANNGKLWSLAEHQGTFVNTTNSEIFHTYGNPSVVTTSSGDLNPPQIYGGGNPAYGISPEISGLFLPGDLRPGVFFMAFSGIEVMAKWSNTYTIMGAYNYRLAEAYLNRAEAYAAKGEDSKAYNDVRTLLESRVADIGVVTIPQSGLDLKRFIFDERRREFCFENFRWFDLKRTKLFPKQIEHRFTQVSNTGTTIGTESYILTPNDPNFVYPIPSEEFKANSSMIQNSRIEKLPIMED